MEYRFASQEYFLIYMPPTSYREGDILVVEMIDRPFKGFHDLAKHCKNYACHSREEYLNFDPMNHDKPEKFSSGFSADKVLVDAMWKTVNARFAKNE
ncbi:hypothetical protein [Saccharibacillus brassicae]|uniref:Uncharacterized protein n=1 Tax=Saccharibacillus brassicae TaxID=2583377 RepID=A0A4Y6UQU4_SACBS|nr:hypothetical protein [Saccharibacillus brassicae]QDH19434.1 hypothetical protein FFV09_00300 [Saccharibacillus brassicae]